MTNPRRTQPGDPLTTRQQEIYDLLVKHTGADGYCRMTYSDIAKACGFAHHTGAVCHIQALERKGLVESPRGQYRSIRIVGWEDNACPCCGGTGQVDGSGK